MLWITAAPAHAQEAPPASAQIGRAQALIEAGKPGEAYDLLQPLEAAHAGDILYDYLLGVSAVDAGKPGLAVFALERVQETEPGYRDAELWLAIAHYQSGDMERAKLGFAAVQARGRDAESRARAEQYLAAIKQRDEAAAAKSAAPYLVGKVEIGIGRDSNIANSSSGVQAATAPTSNLAGMESSLGVSVEGRVPFSGHYAYLAVDDGRHAYAGNRVMNSDNSGVKAGMNFAVGGHSYKVDVERRQFRQEGVSAAATAIVNDYDLGKREASARFRLTADDYVGFAAQYNAIRYLTDAPENTDQMLLGANYLHRFGVGGSPVVYFGYAHVDDNAVQTKVAHNAGYNGGQTVAGRITDSYTLYLQYSPNDKVDVYTTEYMNLRRDTGAYARDAVVVFGEDKTRYLSLGLNWHPRPAWTLRAQLAKTTNRSNIAFYSYDKVGSLVTLKREF